MDNEKTIQNPAPQDQSITELLGHVASDIAILFHEEMALAKQEFSEKIQALRNGALMIAIGAVIGLAAFATFLAAFVIWLTSYLAPAIAAVVTGCGLALIGAIIGFIGIRLWQKTTTEPIKSVEALQGRTGNG
jgi:hypothetical protein